MPVWRVPTKSDRARKRITVFSFHFVPWWKFNYAWAPDVDVAGEAGFEARFVPPSSHLIFYSLQTIDSSPARRAAASSGATRSVAAIRVTFLRTPGCFMANSMIYVMRVAQGGSGCARNEVRVGAGAGRRDGSARHWPPRHRSSAERWAARPHQPASTYVNK